MKAKLLLLTFEFLIFAFASSFVQAAEIVTFKVGASCFRKEECESPPYNGTVHSEQLCKTVIPTIHTKEAIDRGYTYACYAPSPTTKLQVSIGGYEVTGIENYVRRLFVYLIGIVGIVAGIMIVWAGLKWLTSGGSPERINDAKQKIGNAAIGMVLALSSYVLLQTINPALVQLRLPSVKMARVVQEIKNNPCRSSASKFPCGGSPGAEITDRTTWQGYANPTGLYQCDPSKYGGENPCDQPVTECWGSYCAGGQGGCSNILTDRMLGPEIIGTGGGTGELYLTQNVPGIREILQASRICASAAKCQGCNINLRNTDGSYNPRAIAECASSACNCLVVVPVSQDEPIYCTKVKGVGQDCNDDAECDSSQGLQCVPGGVSAILTQLSQLPLIPSAQPPSGGKCYLPQADDLPCAEDSDCANGVCGQQTGVVGGYTWQCTGGKGNDCGREDMGAQCAPGLTCVDTWGGGGICSDRTLGSPCRRSSDCAIGCCRVGDECVGWESGETLVRVGECR